MHTIVIERDGGAWVAAADQTVADPAYMVVVGEPAARRAWPDRATLRRMTPAEISAKEGEEGDKARALADRLAALAARFARERDRGVTVTIDGVPRSISTTHAARQELRALEERLAASGGAQDAATRAGETITWTHAMAAAARQAIDDHHAAVWEADYQHVVNLKALHADGARTAADILAYDIATGWT